MSSSGAGAETASLSAATYAVRVAVETDWEFLNIFGGSQAAATDYIGDLFAFASSIYEQEVDDAVDALSSLLEPLIMSILGILIGGLVVAMYLPIFKLGAAI